MITTRKLQKNTRKSFALARQDIQALYDHVSMLHHVVKDLNDKIDNLSVGKVVRKFVASKTSTKIHTDKCAFAKNIKAKNKLNFKSKETALVQGYVACNCVA